MATRTVSEHDGTGRTGLTREQVWRAVAISFHATAVAHQAG